MPTSWRVVHYRPLFELSDRRGLYVVDDYQITAEAIRVRASVDNQTILPVSGAPTELCAATPIDVGAGEWASMVRSTPKSSTTMLSQSSEQRNPKWWTWAMVILNPSQARINETIFKTHRYQLVKFGSFAGRIRRASSRDTGIESIRVDGDERDVEDMVNTFKILYASVISGPFKFEPPVLISAFRVAKAHDYPALRTYCIEQLEECEEDLSPMQHIELARVFDPNSREVATYDAMCKRDKPLTEAETRILGILATRRIARVREQEKETKLLKRRGVLPCGYDVHEAWGRNTPNGREVSECGWRGVEDEEARQQQKKKDEEYRSAWKKQEELEALELEERRRGYEEARQRHQEWRKQEELNSKRRVEEPQRREQEYEREGNEHGWEQEQEQGWRGHEQGWKVGETSNPPMKGKNNAASRAFSALSSSYLAVAGRICGGPKPMMDNPKPENGHASDAKDDSTLFDEYVNDFKYDYGSDLDEKKP